MEHDGRIPYETIVAAKSGDSDAIAEIVRHYEPYISHFAKRVMYDEGGVAHEVIDISCRSFGNLTYFPQFDTIIVS